MLDYAFLDLGLPYYFELGVVSAVVSILYGDNNSIDTTDKTTGNEGNIMNE